MLSSTLMLAAAPLQYLTGAGSRAYPVVALTWAVLIISILVIICIGILLSAALVRSRGRATVQTPPNRGHDELPWIYVGVTITVAILFVTSVWTVVTLAQVATPPADQRGPEITIVAHQWWWEIQYLDEDPARTFVTANEIHIPVGKPVRIGLTGSDVIHSFWVPSLTGKTDVIPGQTNMTWIEAEKPGIYRGQCTEYCGQQHAHMAIETIASQMDEFEAWRNNQLRPSPAATSPQAANDESIFVTRCGICHTVRGSLAQGILGPNLSHLMSRRTIASGTLPNRPGDLAAWIADPQHVKPGNMMPQTGLSGAELASVLRFLKTLQ